MADDGKPKIFISYSHKDGAALDFVKAHLSGAIGIGTVVAWDDNKLRIGDDWEGDIFAQIDACDIFILLVSCHTLGSKFIREEEVARVIPRWQAKQVRFCPIVMWACHMDGFWWLAKPNRRPKDGQALFELDEAARHKEMAAIVADLVSPSVDPAVASTTGPTAPSVTPRIVDYGRLPETPYRRLVGRDNELTALDEAWLDRATNIVSLVAWGGAGKTSLVKEWLLRLQADNYRGAEAVLGWSFYSQGTKERATSADGFLDWALAQLGITGVAPNSSAKGEALGRALMTKRVLLVLDGIEPLQHGTREQEGLLKDQGLAALLRHFAMTPPAQSHGLIVLTTRLEVRNIENYRRRGDRPGSSLVIDLVTLSDDAGAELLKDNGVKGSDKELREAAHAFEGHALALSLLASFLVRRFHGDVRQRDRIGPLMQKTDMRGHGHARRVMQAYEKEWLKDEPVLTAIMNVIGLFDRPATKDCIDALRQKPAIAGLTEALVELDSGTWADAIATLRDMRLLDPEDPSSPNSLDAHPLVREWFGERLKALNEQAWCEAHGRLYEHLRDTTKEGKTPTLDDLAPLYQAIAHGCRAGRYREALDEIYKDRICRRRLDGSLEFYSVHKLGALGSDLAAISWFFGKPFVSPVSALRDADRSWALNQAVSQLRAQGRFAEALPAMRAALKLAEDAKNWKNAAAGASNLSEIELVTGAVPAAVVSSETCVAHADRSGEAFHMMGMRTTHADALHAAGRLAEAETQFADAERRQDEWQPEYPLLYSLQGYRYSDLLLGKGQWEAARERAQKVLEWEVEGDSLLDRALVRLSLGRASLGLALTDGLHKHRIQHDQANTAGTYLNQAVDGLRGAGTFDILPRGLLARAAFHRSVGDWVGAARDLDEVEEIAEPGPMKLFLCDMALERARLALARAEAFAPLNGMLETNNPTKPQVPSAERIAELKTEAAAQLKIAADYIASCGYHRRDAERDELRAVLDGKKNFADLPPRV